MYIYFLYALDCVVSPFVYMDACMHDLPLEGRTTCSPQSKLWDFLFFGGGVSK